MKVDVESGRLRRLLSDNIKAQREILHISQEKLAELADVSVQMINGIEGCRTWVSDKTLVKLARVLRVDVFQLLAPALSAGAEERERLLSGLLGSLREEIKDEVDAHFDRFVRLESGRASLYAPEKQPDAVE
ncbi:MAG: helix-turn-helix domain-containing protein [Treponema sp.]|jgi:transcriptional regulator with XRE-family HTH domain|nr:helix-turn-helix domain-containing protein [Treponema sp.]